MQTKVVTATSKGQITLPKSWRSQYNTSQFIVSESENGLFIKPLDLGEIDNLEEYENIENNENYEVIFNAKRDNNGKGIPSSDLIKMLQELNG